MHDCDDNQIDDVRAHESQFPTLKDARLKSNNATSETGLAPRQLAPRKVPAQFGSPVAGTIEYAPDLTLILMLAGNCIHSGPISILSIVTVTPTIRLPANSLYAGSARRRDSRLPIVDR